MVLKLIKKVFGLLFLTIGIFWMLTAIIAFTGIDTSMFSDENTHIIGVLNESIIDNFLVLIFGCYFSWFGLCMLLGRTKKTILNMNINYEIVEIETNDNQNTVKLLLKDDKTGDIVSIERETKNLAYFKGYIELFGNRMLGSFAKTI